MAALKSHGPAPEPRAALLFPKDFSGHSSSPTLLPQSSYSQNFLWRDEFLLPQTWIILLPLWRKGLVRPGFSCKPKPVGLKWGEDDERARFWGKAMLIGIFTLPGLVFPEHYICQGDHTLLGWHWRSLQFLPTYTSCYLNLLKYFRSGIEQDEVSISIYLLPLSLQVEISVLVAAVNTLFYLGFFCTIDHVSKMLSDLLFLVPTHCSPEIF